MIAVKAPTWRQRMAFRTFVVFSYVADVLTGSPIGYFQHMRDMRKHSRSF